MLRHPVLRRLFLVVWLPATALPVLRPHAATLALPAPTGQYPVATSRWIVTDPVRQETFAPGGPRRIEVIVWYGSMIERTLGRPLMMVYSARPGRLGASDAIYSRAAAPYYRVDVADTRHLDFTDMVWWPALRARKITGAIEGDRAVAITRASFESFSIRS